MNQSLSRTDRTLGPCFPATHCLFENILWEMESQGKHNSQSSEKWTEASTYDKLSISHFHHLLPVSQALRSCSLGVPTQRCASVQSLEQFTCRGSIELFLLGDYLSCTLFGTLCHGAFVFQTHIHSFLYLNIASWAFFHTLS